MAEIILILQESYLGQMCAKMARGAWSCAVTEAHFIQGSNCASVWRSVRPSRGEGFERGGHRWWHFAWWWRDRDGARHLYGNSEGRGVGEVRPGVNGRGGAAVTKLLPLLPLVQLPHHPLLCGHSVIGGHSEVAEPVVGVLIVAGQVTR